MSVTNEIIALISLLITTQTDFIFIVTARDALMQSVSSTNEALVATRWTTDQRIVLGTSVEKERMLENLSLSTLM